MLLSTGVAEKHFPISYGGSNSGGEIFSEPRGPRRTDSIAYFGVSEYAIESTTNVHYLKQASIGKP